MCKSKLRFNSSIKIGPKEGCEKDRGHTRAFVNTITEPWIQLNTAVIKWRYSAEPKANEIKYNAGSRVPFICTSLH